MAPVLHFSLFDPMPLNYDKAFAELSADIDEILARKGPELEKMETCFSAALRHWEKFKASASELRFAGRKDEIRFFKFIKPQFTGLVEYYTQRYQALLFIPSGTSASVLYFWKMEFRRIERFFARHEEFVRYYEQGETEMDELYFLREFGDGTNLDQARVYDLDARVATSHDWLVSKILAMNMYRDDVENAIHRLEGPGGYLSTVPGGSRKVALHASVTTAGVFQYPEK
jgi:hypothetical protein